MSFSTSVNRCLFTSYTSFLPKPPFSLLPFFVSLFSLHNSLFPNIVVAFVVKLWGFVSMFCIASSLLVLRGHNLFPIRLESFFFVHIQCHLLIAVVIALWGKPRICYFDCFMHKTRYIKQTFKLIFGPN